MGNEIDIHIGRRLRQKRKILGLTQQQVASLADLTFQQIQKYECAANRLSAARLWTLARVLGVTPQYFYDGLAGAHDEKSPAHERSADKETQELLWAYKGLGEVQQRRLLDLAKAMNGED